MFPFHFDEEIFIPFLVFSIPMIAITGGIILGVVRALGRQRALEMAQRERIAAIERGIDPAKLPPINLGGNEAESLIEGSLYNPLRRAQGLLIGGLVTLFAGIGITVFLMLMLRSKDGDEAMAWAVGLIPTFVGAALLLSSWIVWPKGSTFPRP